MANVVEGAAFPHLPVLGDLGGRVGQEPLVLFFYPAADTGG